MSPNMFQKFKTKGKNLTKTIKKAISRPSTPDPSGSVPQHKDGAGLHTPPISQRSSVNPPSTALTQTQNHSPGLTEHAEVALQPQSFVDIPAIVIDSPRPQANSSAGDVVSPKA